MKYIKTYEAYGSILLNLSNNIDYKLVNKIKSILNNGDSILEISCGNGSDAIELSKFFKIIATDTDNNYVEYVNSKGVECINHDTKEKFPFNDNEFDLIYSRLGLHYFEIDELSKIFKELNRICNGYLLFTVKLVNDIQTGKVIFTKDVWENLVNDQFNIVSSEVKNGKLYDNECTWLEVLATPK